MKVVMNELRNKIVGALEKETEGLTLAEIAEKVGVEKISTGTTNPMVSAGILRKVGTKKVAKTIYVEVATYAMGEMPTEKEGE